MFPFVFSLLVLIGLVSCNTKQNDFKIEEGKFSMNGESIQLICGEMHYPRVPKEYWKDRLERAKAMGINTISTYVFWNFHERQPGEFDFSGQADLSQFIKTAQEVGLYVVLRPGPYVCAEWDFGGYPYWLLNEKDMTFRTKDPKFLAACERYISRLGEELQSQTITNGGNIILVQIENEYGSFGNDKEYLNSLKSMIEKAGFNVPLMTCDGGGQMEAGFVEGALPGINGVFGEDLFRIVDKFQEGGPYFVAEFYPAWFNVWGQRHSKVDKKRPTEQLDWMLGNGVSVSMYMFHGGSNFWYTNGANTAYGYAPQPTSYDYDAPLGEWGNAYPKYHAFREVIQKHLPEGKILPEVPADNPTVGFSEVKLMESAPLSSAFHERVEAKQPLSMEDLKQDFGYIHYETTLTNNGEGRLTIYDLRDYAVLLIDGKQVGSLDRRYNQNSIDLKITEAPVKLEIIVENVGRVNYGQDIQHNRKGITDKVVFNGHIIEDWTITSLPLYKEDVSKLAFSNELIEGVPAFHRGSFNLDSIGDTFIDMSSWTKGAVWVNGKSIGKFWNIGPQQTLYVPAPWLKEGENEIVVFTMEDSGSRTLQGLDQPILDVLGKDINFVEYFKEEKKQTPIIEEGDKLLSATMEATSDWQTFEFDQSTFRHCAIQVNSSYNDDKLSCLLEVDFIDAEGNVIPKSEWNIAYVTSEWSKNNIGVAQNIIDGDISSFWQTDSDNKVDYPHVIIVDLGEIYNVKAFKVKSRGGSYVSGQVKDFSLYARPQFFLFK